MRVLSILAAGALSFGAANAALAGPSVQIKDAAVRVEVIPEARGDVAVEIVSSNPRLPLKTSGANGDTVIDGGLASDAQGDRVQGCPASGGERVLDIRGVGPVKWADLPQVRLRVPMATQVAANGAVYGRIGKAESVSLNLAGCGDWALGDVKGALAFNQAGSGETQAGDVGSLEAHIADSGRLSVHGVAGDLKTYIAGSGEVRADSVGHKFEAHIAGRGAASVASGRVDEVEVSILGPGHAEFNGVAGRVSAAVTGKGVIRVAKAEGAVSQAVAGGGQVIIGR